jgi:phage replication O-like protein O
MAKPQKENGYAPIANELLEAIIKFGFGRNELEILLYVLRRTYGYSCKVAKIRQVEISKITGISKGSLSMSFNKLVEMNVLETSECAGVGIQKDYEKWTKKIKCVTKKVIKTITYSNEKSSEIKNNSNEKSSEIKNSRFLNRELLVLKSRTSGTTPNNPYNVFKAISKETKTKPLPLKTGNPNFQSILATTVFGPIALRFLEFRKAIKKPIKSQMSLRAWLSRLKDLSHSDYKTAQAIVEQSIANGWQGIFEIKNKSSPQLKNDNPFAAKAPPSKYEQLERKGRGLDYTDSDGNLQRGYIWKQQQSKQLQGV